MRIFYVDLSAKLEQWASDSAVAVSDGASWAYLVPSVVKQRARDWLLQRHGRRTVRYRLLATLIYIAVRDDLADVTHVVIDRDYAGPHAEATIKNVLLRLIRREMPTAPAALVQFANVKGRKADELARRVHAGKAQATRVLTWVELERWIGQ